MSQENKHKNRDCLTGGSKCRDHQHSAHDRASHIGWLAGSRVPMLEKCPALEGVCQP